MELYDEWLLNELEENVECDMVTYADDVLTLIEESEGRSRMELKLKGNG